jgi:lipid II:glycine glycyltransferase (peptidoglycan interpeptide bridge formation enzyme)
MPYTFETFTRLDKAITTHNAGIKFGAYNADRVLVAVSYLLWDQNTAYYFLAGDNDEGRSSGASILLCREALRIAFEERKIKSFDFCGSMLEPVSEIRRQFGARTVPLMKIFKARYKWLDILYTITR